VNVAEEAAAEELLPYKELFTTVVLEQGLVAAATSCFHACSSNEFNCHWYKFNCQSDELNYESDEFNCQFIIYYC